MRSPAWLARRSGRADALVVLVLSFHSALGFLSPGPCHTPHLAHTHDIATRSSSRSSSSSSTCRLALVSPAPLQQPRQRFQRTACRLSRTVAAASLPGARAAAGGGGGSLLSGDVGAQKRMGPTAGSSTALSLGSGNQVEGDGRGDEGDKGGWRQRMVQTVVTVFLRMKAVFMALASRLGFGLPGKVTIILARIYVLVLAAAQAQHQPDMLW